MFSCTRITTTFTERPPGTQYNPVMARTLLRLTRTTHLYFGVFIAPALLFFAFTGALQTFSLHETTRGSSYQPPRWAVVLGQIHKKQTSIVALSRPQPPTSNTTGKKPSTTEATPAKPADTSSAPAPKRHPLPLKIFFVIVSIGLFTSTLTGLYMSYKYAGDKRLITALLIAGAVIPIALIFV
jgi:hypothetical protein